MARRAERILLGGWGQELALGALTSLLDDISPQEAYRYIEDGRDMVPEDLSQYKRLAARVDILKILQVKKVLDTISSQRPDLASIILNHPGGMAWLERQVRLARERLTGP